MNIHELETIEDQLTQLQSEADDIRGDMDFCDPAMLQRLEEIDMETRHLISVIKQVGAIIFFHGERFRILPPGESDSVGSYATRTDAIRAAKRNGWEVAE